MNLDIVLSVSKFIAFNLQGEIYMENLIFKEGVYYTKGFKNSIIYDSNNNEMYKVDNEASRLIDDMLDGNIKIEDNEFLKSTLLDTNLVEYGIKPLSNAICDKDYLDKVWLELRKSCNMSCVHCYNSSNPNAENKCELMSKEQWFEIIKQLKEYNPKTVILIGGEPLMYKGVDEIIEYIRKNIPNTVIVLYSNLTLLTNKLLLVLKENDVKVVTSIYGSNADIHDRVTTVKGSFDKTVNSIKLLKNNDISIKANVVEMSINENDIENTKTYIKELTGKDTKVDIVRNVKEGLEYLQPKATQKERVIRNVKNISNMTSDRYLKNMRGNYCWQGKINICYDGTVTPCIMFQGNKDVLSLRNNTLSKVLEDNVVKNYWSLSKDKIDVCKDCEYRYFCPDCRPMARGKNKSSVKCMYNPYLGEWKVNESLLCAYENSEKVNAKINDSKVAFILSCPGKKEQISEELCAGKTGENLNKLIELLNQSMPKVFKGKSKDEYFITNSSNRVHYKAYTNSSEPTISEIKLPENMSRLYNELSDKDVIICCGVKARKAIELLEIKAKIVKVCHIGQRGLAKSYSNLSCVDAKLEKICELICDTLKENM